MDLYKNSAVAFGGLFQSENTFLSSLINLFYYFSDIFISLFSVLNLSEEIYLSS